ncbi:MAG: alternate F1F0 ATPase, F1 subunit alpha [Desulfobacterales bacterium]
MQNQSEELKDILIYTFDTMDRVSEEQKPRLKILEVGEVSYVGPGIARVTGLTGVKADEVLYFAGDVQGMVFNVDRDEVGVILMEASEKVKAGSEVWRTNQVMNVPVGEALMGRILSPRAQPLDGLGTIPGEDQRPIERPAPEIMDRAPVIVPLQTGLKVVDALIPIGRGQRELILGDRQTGKTTVAVDTIINQKNTQVICIYCGIGKRSSAVAKVIADLRENEAMDYSIVLFATEEDPPGLQFIAPYTAMTMAEYFMENGKDVLVVFDDLTRHARAYRELSLLLRRPPGREAFPGDIFYVHSRLLERSTHLREELGGGSITALPVIETEAQNISAYIPTNLISITDGQIYLSPDLHQKGHLPAVDVGKSVSRVGGKTQLPAYRLVAGDLRLSYSQFEELESFARFGTRLDEDTRKTLERGKRVREVLKQPQYQPLSVSDQIAVLLAVNEGLFDNISIHEISAASQKIQDRIKAELPEQVKRIESGEKLEDDDIQLLLKTAGKAMEMESRPMQTKSDDTEASEEKQEKEPDENADNSGPETQD